MPAVCSGPEYRQFDFWVGEWDVTGANGTLAGRNSIVKSHAGCVIQESWRGAGGMTGSSLNAFNPLTRRWHQTWTDSTGLLLLLDGEFRDGAMVLTGEGFGPKGRTLNRISWRPLSTGGVRQQWEVSTDEGRTWTLVFDGAYRERTQEMAGAIN